MRRLEETNDFVHSDIISFCSNTGKVWWHETWIVYMKKYDLVKGIDFMCSEYGIGLVLATDGFGTLKVYWPKENIWCLIIEKNVVKI